MKKSTSVSMVSKLHVVLQRLSTPVMDLDGPYSNPIKYVSFSVRMELMDRSWRGRFIVDEVALKGISSAGLYVTRMRGVLT